MSHGVTEESFLKDVATHEMIVLRDEGLYRHVRFKRPDTMCMHFDLVTWPGYLAYSGDMGSYVFSRLADMFEFFRRPEHCRYQIDMRYWAEKVQASDKCDGIEEFSEELFERAVYGDLVEWIRENRGRTTKEERRELWDAVVSEVIGADSDSGGYRKQVAAHDFYHRVNDRMRFDFSDFGEHSVTDYTQRFAWCCQALAWGIKQYDDAKQPQEQAA